MARASKVTAAPPKVRPPTEIRLTPSTFPAEPWAKQLVEAVNQFSVETVKAINIGATGYKVLAFTTGPVVADSFPIDIPVDAAPSEVRFAQLQQGAAAAGAVPGVLWQVLAGGKTVRVSLISGLSPSTSYVIRLALE